jgi:hypothetical protein
MFLCVVAHPLFDTNGNCTFDGTNLVCGHLLSLYKHNVVPIIVQEELGKQNQSASTTSMTSILHYFLVDKTFTCHPGKGGHEMISQLSQSEYNTINAPVHCTKDDPVFFVAAASLEGWQNLL